MTQQTYPIRARIRAQDSGVTRVDVYDDIGEGGWFSEGLTAKNFAAQLRDVKGALEVHVNSGGGDVFDGISIGNSIRNHKGPVTTVVDGLAASIASVIAQAGQERVVQPGSMLMIHDAFGACVGNAAEMAKMALTLGSVSDNIAGIYASRAGGSDASWRDAMREETWYTAEEAVAAGLADRVGDGEAELPAGMDLAAFSTVPGRIAARLRTLPQAKAPVIVDADGNHAPMSGSHAHAHPAFGSQGDDSTHAHDHGHDGDADHDHSHAGTQDRGGPHIFGETQGACCQMCGPDCACGGIPANRGRVVILDAKPRVLGIESMPLANEALPAHHTATVDKPWDGPAAVAAMPNDASVLRYCHAWQDSASDDGTGDDPDGDADDKKASYKFPHHTAKGGPANLAACRNGLARLSGASIPDSDRAGVQKHLQAHLDDGGADEDAGNHSHNDLTGIDLEQIRAALRGATE
jgi:ATP-dependent protease ClpP protease subunit